ncbi:hypothetical protein [Leptothoe spongobia]|uniref:Uncharacterized protein n=1 Tax=Leptothoe spongobia TAU-MAC 1115 TaxID=1967444 RepID=A0A947DG11_9CYAN|nr:hypothetical protein [Leptothoe spongobia]MBT9316373.1 hypothetical protein [Leptothoe spongobia TAU-MAC 1115]
MSAKRWPFSKPTGVVLSLRVERLNTEFRQLDIKHTLTHQAHRFRFELTQPSQLLVQVSSTIAQAKGWHRAGYLAHILREAPIANPIADVERLYFGQQYLSIPWTGLGYYLEFWPHTWISNYRIEVWARESSTLETTVSVQNQIGLLLFQTGDNSPEPFTFFGVSILFP